MSYATFDPTAITLRNKRISDEDADRQARTVEQLLARLSRQPGVILADEVGMGKTFVALAAAVSVIRERRSDGPVVVMVPSTLKAKWPRDWSVFKDLCLKTNADKAIRAASADSGIDFLKLLDDPNDRLNHLIFLTHGALHRALSDRWVRLALIQRAFKGRSSLSDQRRNFGKFAGKLMGLESRYESRSEGIVGDLLERPTETWLKTLHRAHEDFKEMIEDDPVPRHVQQVLDDMPSSQLEPLVDALRELPIRSSSNLDERLKDVRRVLASEMRELWGDVLRKAKFTSPLLILDEAHHLKNPETRFASLFIEEEAREEADAVGSGPLANRFERMVFLTATPFQLGHAELIRVLERFEGIAWKSTRPPAITRDEFKTELRDLSHVLDKAQASALRLERAWGRLDPLMLVGPTGDQRSPDDWWNSLQGSEGTDASLADVMKHVDITTETMRAAESKLSGWVVRHVKSDYLPGLPSIFRRRNLPGAAIADGSPENGLPVGGEALLPFLLAGRAQAVLAASDKGRAYFADGLASSFEAYSETRKGRAQTDEEEAPSESAAVSDELQWYLTHLDRALPVSADQAFEAHPKIHATVDRVVRLWLAGEKVLVFCHYRATGRALRRHVSARLRREIEILAGKALPGVDGPAVMDRLEQIGEQFFDKDTDLRRAADRTLTSLVNRHTGLTTDERTLVVDVIRRFLRTPSFLARFFPLEAANDPDVFERALERQDESGVSLREKLDEFCQFLAERCVPAERVEYLAALDSIQTGSYAGRAVDELFDAAEHNDGRTAVRLPNVRLANGETRPETRRRLLLGFNTPLFPEILIASSVLAEGVDLHLNCRYVIHHDLCWNPSTLEQRSGRVDRIGSKAEQVGDSIHLFLPYVAATQDEKMYRVVRDRERWFQIVMGEKYETDESAIDRRAQRIALPDELRRRLAMRLH